MTEAILLTISGSALATAALIYGTLRMSNRGAARIDEMKHKMQQVGDKRSALGDDENGIRPRPAPHAM